MAGTQQASTSQASAVVSFEGHLIDSLTLARVMDLIEELHGEYQLNYLHIAKSKASASKAILTLFKPTQNGLNSVLEALKPYGVKILSDECAQLIETGDDCPTENAFKLHLPKSIQLKDKHIPIVLDPEASNQSEWVIAVNTDEESARLTTKDRLREGDCLMCGYQGLSWS